MVWTSGGLNKLEIYRGLGVGEVWSWRKGRITVHLLEGDRYREHPASRLLPELDLGLLAALATRTDQLEALTELRAAVRRSPT